MLSKIRAAKQATSAGVETIIADGREKGVLQKTLASPHIGTKFLASTVKDINEHKRWLLAAKSFGQIVVDSGAAAALRKSKSLLLPGVISCRGMFDKGEIVEVIDNAGLAVAYGKCNYGQKDVLEALAMRKTKDGGKLEKEVIHSNNMAVIKTQGAL